MWQARNKTDLIIEVWEKLDCESIGRLEIEAIETAVRTQFGSAAVDSPMIVARLLADEGAELRHNEIMELYVERRSKKPHDAVLRNLIDVSGFSAALRSIKSAENLRRKLKEKDDREGLRLLRADVLGAKESLLKSAKKTRSDDLTRAANKEVAMWLTLWLQSPELFDNWVRLRLNSEDFISTFGKV
jgi:hypothetical protein